jgi:hypothetical protein
MFPAPRRHRRKRQVPDAAAPVPPPPPPPPPPPGLAIVSVTGNPGDGFAAITFSADIVWDGESSPSAFRVLTASGMQGALSVLDVGADWIVVEFDAGLAEDATWELNAAMAGITPAVAWPQSGVVTP